MFSPRFFLLVSLQDCFLSSVDLHTHLSYQVRHGHGAGRRGAEGCQKGDAEYLWEDRRGVPMKFLCVFSLFMSVWVPRVKFMHVLSVKTARFVAIGLFASVSVPPLSLCVCVCVCVSFNILQLLLPEALAIVMVDTLIRRCMLSPITHFRCRRS